MTTYRYKGQTKDGTAVSGVIRAYDEFEAASRLRETVAIITRLEEVREKKESIFNRPIGLKIKEKELALICSQFAIILSAGMSIQHCVEMVAAQTRNRHIRQMLEKVAEEVGAGYSMAQSFENNAPYLPKTFIETVRAGEQSGTLEECFQRLHRYYDKSAKTKAKVVSTLTYRHGHCGGHRRVYYHHRRGRPGLQRCLCRDGHPAAGHHPCAAGHQ